MILVDGYNGGVAHITADQIRDHNIAMYGDGDYVLPVGDKFAYEIVNNNTINMSSGMVVMCGARAVTGYGKTEVLTIENGTSGYKRADIIVAEYSKDNETLVESVTVKVVKGTLGSAYSDPALVTGDIRAGATKRQMALYRVKVNVLSIEAVEKMWTASNGAAMNKLMKIPASELSFLTGNGTGDTPTNWAKVGMGMAYFSTEGVLANQPMKYGWLLNHTAGSSIVAQQFIGLDGNSPVWYRSGNASGWYPGSKNWVRSLDEKNGVQIKKVWQNASPTSAFGNQKLDVDLSGYSFAMILFKLDANGRVAPPSIVPIGQPAVNAYGNSTRFFLVHTQDITFDSVGPSASVMIPYQIYGMKGVI